MPEQSAECLTPGIPSRLHSRGRPAAGRVENSDRVYIRHRSLGDSGSYGLEIPGYRLEDQSANSHELNAEGVPQDVLLDTLYGQHHFDQQIACIEVNALVQLTVKNPNVVRYGRDGRPLNDPDEYTFRVAHVPTPCMYPHCEIYAHRNGKRTDNISKGIRTTLRSEIAKLADTNRLEMLKLTP